MKSHKTQPNKKVFLKNRQSEKEKGVIAILMALLLPIVIGLGAFAIDLSYRFLIR